MNLLLEISNNALAVTATLTGIGLVFAALLIAKLISRNRILSRSRSLMSVVYQRVASQ